MGTANANTATERICVDDIALVRRIIRKHFAGYRYDDDFFQEAWIGLWDAERRFDGSRGVPFGAFAAVIIKKRCLDELRRRRRLNRLPVVSIDHPVADTTLTYLDVIPDGEDAHGSAFSVIAADELLNAVKRSGLSETDVKVLDRRISGQTFRQISDGVGICSKKVRQSMRAIREAFRALTALDYERSCI